MFLRKVRPFWKTIGFRLSLWYGSIFLLSAFTLFVITHLLVSSILIQRDRDLIRFKLNEISVQYENVGLEELRSSVEFESEQTQNRFFIRIADKDNRTLLATEPGEFYEDFDLSILEKQTIQEQDWIRIHERDEDEFEPFEPREELEVATLILSDGNRVQVGLSSEERLSTQIRFYMIFALIMIPLFLLGAIIHVSRTIRPLRDIINTVRTIQAGKRGSRVPVRKTGDELDELGTLFNELLERIDRLIDAMRSSLDNVAHDLRTPATRLRSIAEMALQSEQDGNVYREALSDCLEESERILSMLNTLMDISEAETGVMKMNLEPVDASQLIQDTVDLYQHVAEEKNIRIGTTCDGNYQVFGDRNRLRQILANLLDNAIKYTEAGGAISLQCSKVEDNVMIAIADTGIGITSGELPHIWDRLYRGERGGSEKGLGLGLSLVKAIVRAHNGSVEISTDRGKGSTFKVYLRSI